MSKPMSAPKAPFSFKRHILAPFVGVFIFLSVLGLLNAQWVTAQAQYRFAKPSLQLSDTFYTGVPETKDPTIYIPKINAQAPVVFDKGTREDNIQLGLRDGTVHYDLSAKPGQKGNAVIFGHSSSMPWDSGDYKFIFTLLDKLVMDDKIIIDYDGVRYIYAVTGMHVVTPDDVSVLDQATNDNKLTLITCTPVGSNSKRLIVQATQISPKPTTTPVTTATKTTPITTTNLPGSSKSFWQSLGDIF